MAETPQGRRDHLTRLFDRQGGKCRICGYPARLDFNGGNANSEVSAVRFRVGSSFGAKGRVRPRVMAHRGCAQARNREIEQSLPIEELRLRARNKELETYSIPGAPNEANDFVALGLQLPGVTE